VTRHGGKIQLKIRVIHNDGALRENSVPWSGSVSWIIGTQKVTNSHAQAWDFITSTVTVSALLPETGYIEQCGRRRWAGARSPTRHSAERRYVCCIPSHHAMVISGDIGNQSPQVVGSEDTHFLQSKFLRLLVSLLLA
jgi:hypothetical protein